MATSGRVVTVEDLIETKSELFLDLQRMARSLADEKPPESGFIRGSIQAMTGLLQKAEADLNAEDGETVEEMEMQVDEIFDSMVGNVQEVREVVKKKVRTLKPGERKEVLTFWTAVGKFLTNVLDWIKNMFNNVLEKIRQGYQVVKGAVSGLFKTVIEFLNKIF